MLCLLVYDVCVCVLIFDACRGNMTAVHVKANLVLRWVCAQMAVHDRTFSEHKNAAMSATF